MKDTGQHSFDKGTSRRDFIKNTAAAAALATAASVLRAPAHDGSVTAGVSLVLDDADTLVRQPPVTWAAGQLREALKARGIAASIAAEPGRAAAGSECILVAGRVSDLARQALESAGSSIPDVPEALGLVRGKVGGRAVLLATGSDVRGLVYALLELADRVTFSETPAAALNSIERIVEQTANPVRSIARLFTSHVEDKPWFYDKEFWSRYLTMLVAQRFNRFNLTLGLGYNSPRNVRDSYFYFAYPFLLAVPGYNVRARGLPDVERDRNLATLRWISDETAARGLHFQLALWTHACEFRDSPQVNYTIEGLTPQTHGPYCRDALTALLEACPSISGVTFRCHSESGIPQGSYDFWPMIFEGVKRCRRRVEIDIHSKSIEHLLLDMALETGLRVTVSPKYWAEHMGLAYHQTIIQEGEKYKPVAGKTYTIEQRRRFTRYGYGDYLREDRRYGVLYRIWPGTQRFLLWGDPATAAGYGRYSHFCGSDGLELCEPLSFKGRMGSGLPGGRNGYADASLLPEERELEKHLYTYRLWGRLLYDPGADPDSWRRYLRAEFGPASADCEAALAAASRVLPLITTAHLPSASNNAYWPEIFTSIPIVGRRFAGVAAIDPGLFSSVKEYVDELLSRQPSGKYSPLDAARWLTDLSDAADAHLARAGSLIADPAQPSFRRLSVDVAIQSGTGRFVGLKMQAAVAFEIFERTGGRTALDAALTHYRAARDAWLKVAAAGKSAYREDLTYGLSDHLRGHWADRLPAIDRDLADMEAAQVPAATSDAGAEMSLAASQALAVLATGANPPPSRARCEHLAPAVFRPGQPLAVELAVEAGYKAVRVRIHYRHVDQSKEYEVAEMTLQGGRYRYGIPGAYTKSPYPLLYYFELHDAAGQAWLYPGFRHDLSNQPYFVVRQAT